MAEDRTQPSPMINLFGFLFLVALLLLLSLLVPLTRCLYFTSERWNGIWEQTHPLYRILLKLNLTLGSILLVWGLMLGVPLVSFSGGVILVVVGLTWAYKWYLST